jgi:hypothetical protein
MLGFRLNDVGIAAAQLARTGTGRDKRTVGNRIARSVHVPRSILEQSA